MRTTSVEVKPPKLKSRIVWSVVVVLLCMGLQWGYGVVQGPVEGSLAVQQAGDDAEAYMVGKAAATANIPGIIRIGEVLVLATMWGTYALQAGRYAAAKDEETPAESDA